MKKLVILLTAIIFIAAVRAAAVPIIGGDPIHTEEDYFTADGWGLTIYSYVFDNTSTSLPGSFTLDPGEMLFMYLLDGDDTKTTSVEYFSIYNPDDLPIPTTGYVQNNAPSGYDAGKRQDPMSYEYSGLSKTISYYYKGGWGKTIEPDEWSLVYYKARSSSWAPAVGTVAAAGSDEQDVPAPVIPEPTTIFLLSLGALVLVRVRKRKA